MDLPLIYADFQNADPSGRVRLTCVGTAEDLNRQQVVLREGLELELYTDDGDAAGNRVELRLTGKVQYSSEDNCWVAVVDWDSILRTPPLPSARTSDTTVAGPQAPPFARV